MKKVKTGASGGSKKNLAPNQSATKTNLLSELTPTVMEAAEMAEQVYTVSVGDTVSGGWECIEVSPDGRIAVYEKTAPDGSVGHCVVVRGTTHWLDGIKPSSDAINNIQQPFGASQDMKDSIKYAGDFVDAHPDSKVTFVGHSKGGAEAAAMAVRTNTDCIVFNPATANLSAYGLSADTYTADMSVYCVKGEILNNALGPISKPIDDFTYLNPASVDAKSSATTKHGMDAVIRALGEAGYR